jgi:hypothetical protein
MMGQEPTPEFSEDEQAKDLIMFALALIDISLVCVTVLKILGYV